jgi:hypothetical protein
MADRELLGRLNMHGKMRDGSVADWQRAPKDGSIINVEFVDGEITRARWDVVLKHWQVPRSDGNLVTMELERHDLPQDWWPVF